MRQDAAVSCIKSEAAAVDSRHAGNRTTWEDQFSRCRGLLYFLACRVLGGSEGADDAVRRCRITAAKNQTSFEYEGNFRGRLARILIDEA